MSVQNKNQKQMIALIEKKYPQLNPAPAADFNGRTDSPGIWLKGTEDAYFDDEGQVLLLNYWSEDYQEITYIMNVHKALHAWLEAHGWYIEWNDPGTAFAYPI